VTGTFIGRIEDLKKLVGGSSKLQGKVVVDQVYAKFQHESLDLKHTGGGAKFLTKALVQNQQNILRAIARGILDGKQNEAMAKGMENISTAVYKNAPHEFNDLRNSSHPTVKSGGRIIYDRAPLVRRLTQSQLRAKDRARGKK
jgi:hypothetical protein